MDIVQSLRSDLQSDELEENWRNTIESMQDDESLTDKLLNWVSDYRDEFLELAEDVEDPNEVKTSLVVRYIEMKCHWMMLNTHMQYQAVNTGQPDTEIMLKGSLISQLLEKLEQFLDQDEVEKITQFLSKPIDALEGSEIA